MRAFTTLAAQECPAHEELAHAVAAELGCSVYGIRRAVGALAAQLPAATEPLDQLEAVRALCAGALRARPNGHLLLPDVLRARGGEPAGVALAVAAAAQRRGLDVDLVGGGDRLLIAHPAVDDPLVVDPEAPERLLDGHRYGTDLHWRCGHESAATILDLLARRAERFGDLTLATAACTLGLELPLCEDSRALRAAERDRVLSRLN